MRYVITDCEVCITLITTNILYALQTVLSSQFISFYYSQQQNSFDEEWKPEASLPHIRLNTHNNLCQQEQ